MNRFAEPTSWQIGIGICELGRKYLQIFANTWYMCFFLFLFSYYFSFFMPLPLRESKFFKTRLWYFHSLCLCSTLKTYIYEYFEKYLSIEIIILTQKLKKLQEFYLWSLNVANRERNKFLTGICWTLIVNINIYLT